MKLEDLQFRPHNLVSGHRIAKYNGFSIVHGPLICGDANHRFEVRTPEGEIHTALSVDEVVKIVTGVP